MEDVVRVASYICQRYADIFKERIDEMKLHKMLYFAQRECIVQTGQPMFEAPFEAWKYGPVMVCVRQLYKDDLLTLPLPKEAETKYKEVFDKIFKQYAVKSSWSLSSLAHGEQSWVKARHGLGMYDHSSELMSLDDIRQDAERIKKRRFLLRMLKKNTPVA